MSFIVEAIFLLLESTESCRSVDFISVLSPAAIRRLADHQFNGRRIDTRSPSGDELKDCLRGSIAELADRLSYAGERRKTVRR
jgi:hypothetical protein